MRSADQIIKDKIDRLVNLLMNDGVQPSDLADNIFLGTYKRIDTAKVNGKVITSIVFEEKVNGALSETNLRYTYGLDKRLMKIEEIKNNHSKVEWDRESVESKTLKEILELIQVYGNEKTQEKFLESLPPEYFQKIKMDIQQYNSEEPPPYKEDEAATQTA